MIQDDFHVRDMTEITKALSSTATLMTEAAAGGCPDFSHRRRSGDHEHHAGLGHRANA